MAFADVQVGGSDANPVGLEGCRSMGWIRNDGGRSPIEGVQIPLDKCLKGLPVFHGRRLIATAENIGRAPLFAIDRIAALLVHVGKSFAGGLIHPIGMGDELVNGKAMLPKKPRRDTGAVVLGVLVVLRSLAHDDLNAQTRHVAARSDRTVAGVPGHLGRANGVRRA